MYTVERQGAARTGGVRVPEEEEQKPYPAQCQEHRVCYGTAVSSFLLGKFTYLSVNKKMVMKVKGVGRGIEAAEAVPVEWRGLGLRSRVPGSR